MKRYVLSAEAQMDITNIRKYTTRQWEKAQTEKYTLQLRERMRGLAANRMLGRSRDEVKEGYRSFNEGSHIIFYRLAESAIEIIGILHQNMDIEQKFSDENDFFPNVAHDRLEDN